MPTQAHSKAIWREPSGGGAVLDAAPVYLVDDGAGNVISSLVGPSTWGIIDAAGDGNYILMKLAPQVLIASGSDLVLASSGTPAAIMVDDGAGNLMVSTDLTLTPAADFLIDGAGDVRLVRRSADRLDAALVGDHITFY